METTKTSLRPSIYGEQQSLRRLLIYFVLFLLIGLVLTMIARSIAYIGYNTMDDITIQNLLNGTKGVSDGFCNHMNVFLGAFLAFLYRALPAFNWYGLFLLAMLLISCSIAAAAIAQRLGGKIGFAVGFAIFPLIFMSTLYGLTYTVVAYIMLASAFACITCVFYVKDKSRRQFLWIFAGALTVLSVMLREDVIVSAAGIGFVYALFLLLRYRKTALKAVCITAAILLLSFGFTGISNLLFQTSPVWSEYYKFNETRIDMQDHFYPAYDKNQANFEKYGWSENDYNLFYSANIPDDSKFSAENMEKIDATYKSIDRYDWSIRDVLASFWDYVSHSVPILALLAAAYILALLSSKSRLLATAVLAFPFLMQVALVVIQRPLARVVVPHYYIALMILLCLIDSAALRERFKNKPSAAAKRTFSIVALVLVLGVSGYLLYNTFNYSTLLAEQRRNPHVAGDYQNQLRIYDYFAQHKDNFYVYTMDPGFYSYSENLSIFDTKPKNYYINSFSMGGWAVRSGQYDLFKQDAGVSSLPRDLIDNDHVYLVSVTRLDLYTKYFYETYGIPVKYELVDSLAQYQVLRVKTAASLAEMGTVYKGK